MNDLDIFAVKGALTTQAAGLVQLFVILACAAARRAMGAR
jgi:hypothetical protein